MDRLSGKTVLITAAAAGIGRATAIAAADEGARVLATDINADALAELGQLSPNIETALLDVRNAAAIEAAKANWGDVDVLINAAGFVHNGSILDCSAQDWALAVDLNVTSMIRMIQAVLPIMITRGGGSIVNIASVASSVRGVPNRFAYSTTKAAVIGLTKSVAADFIGQGIRSNAIAPGTVDTPSLQQRMHAQGDYETARAGFVARQPMGRLGSAEEVAALAIYLASNESSYTTGAIHVIDGGWTM